jgi:hypothetical protein
MKLKPEHQDTVIGTFLSVERQIKYHIKNTLPFYAEMEEWDRKEYQEIYKSNIEQSEAMAVYMMQNESIFNKLLSDYGLTVILFIAKVKNQRYE